MKKRFTKEEIQYFREVRKTLSQMAKEDKDLCIQHNNLCGACGFSSYILFKYFREKGYSPYFVHGQGHCWLEFRDCIVDLTATQFGGKSIVIIDSESDTSFYNYNSNRKERCKTEKDIAEAMSGWTYHNPLIMNQSQYKQVWYGNE